MSLKGFIIVNGDWSPSVMLHMGGHTFARTEVEAWRRHIGPSQNSGVDFGTLVQRWVDKGYRLHRVVMRSA